VIVDAKSGISGAGRTLKTESLFSEADESVAAYGLSGHRHLPEIEQTAAALARGGAAPQITFVPHLVPMTRGILATAYLRPRTGVTQGDVREVFRAFCDANTFLRYDPSPPRTKSVNHSNVAALNAGWQDGVAVVTAAVDNLVKGAAGQAVQALNVRFGFDEAAGLEHHSTWP
jgi:N-acetyl-gamma-glutamyl-phosphate reductase